MQRIGTQLIAEKKAAIRAEGEKSFAADKEATMGTHNRDLLTLLLKANMSTDLPENQRLPDEDVLARKSSALIRIMDADHCSQRFRRMSETNHTESHTDEVLAQIPGRWPRNNKQCNCLVSLRTRAVP